MTDEARTSEPISVRKRPIVVQALLWSGGDGATMARINAARDEGLRARG